MADPNAPTYFPDTLAGLSKDGTRILVRDLLTDYRWAQVQLEALGSMLLDVQQDAIRSRLQVAAVLDGMRRAPTDLDQLLTDYHHTEATHGG